MIPKHFIRFPQILFTAVMTWVLLWGVQTATAGVTAEEAAQLKTTLTPLGAERAGNADGTIPAWEGGYTQVPEGYKNGDQRPDFFPDEKPLYSITGQNMDQYKDKLSHGVQFFLKKYPDFRMDVYPTHRTNASPQWVYDNTFKNATRAKLEEGGKGLSGAFGGIPFPIPKNGLEVIWNSRLQWKGEAFEQLLKNMVVTKEGKRVLATEQFAQIQFPYYFKDKNLETYEGYYRVGMGVDQGPPYRAGGILMTADPTDVSKARGAWLYLVGQRRVRRSPSVSYDTPDTLTSGIGFFDEVFMGYGPFFRHDYKLLGKKEMYIMYNGNKAAITPYEDLLTPKFLNPDYIRWELHRVWVVEATLKEGERHTVPRRLYYIDEDSWSVLLIDGWDAKGDLSRLCYTSPILAPDVPCLLAEGNWGTFDLLTGSYTWNLGSNDTTPSYRVRSPWKKGYFSPNNMLRKAR